MSCNVYQVPHEKTSPIFAKAFAQGCGGVVLNKYHGGIWAGFGSPVIWNDIQKCRAEGFTWYYGDHGIFRRNSYFRITKNAYFTHGRGESDGNRARYQVVKPEPWRLAGEFIVVCPQSEGFYERLGTTRSAWINETIETLARHTDRKIIIHGKWDRKPLAAFLPRAHAVVVHSSNSASEAVLAGVPAFCTADCPAWDMCGHDLTKIETPFYPDNRLSWVNSLCDNQWTLEEIASGMAWEFLNRD